MNIRRKNPDEIVLAWFDFALDLSDVPGTTIVSADVDVELIVGVDPDPNNLLGGMPIIDAEFVNNHIEGGVDGCRYKVRCLATFSDGRKVARVKYFDVVAP